MFHHVIKKADIDVAKEIDVLLKDSKNDAYGLSVIVLASAQYVDNAHYNKAITIFLDTLYNLPDNSFKAWMLGRAVLAASLIHDQSTYEKYLPQLKQLLLSVETDNQSSWAWGYLAAVNADEYQLAKCNMMHAVSVLSEKYLQLKQEISHQTVLSDNSPVLKQALSDLLWSYVMCVQAAARSNDHETYNQLLAAMISVTEQSTVRDAMVCVLESDWRAWAVGIVRLSAAIINDTDNYHQLNQLHKEAMQSAKQSGSNANALLSYLCELEAEKIVVNMKPAVNYRMTT